MGWDTGLNSTLVDETSVPRCIAQGGVAIAGRPTPLYRIRCEHRRDSAVPLSICLLATRCTDVLRLAQSPRGFGIALTPVPALRGPRPRRPAPHARALQLLPLRSETAGNRNRVALRANGRHYAADHEPSRGSAFSRQANHRPRLQYQTRHTLAVAEFRARYLEWARRLAGPLTYSASRELRAYPVSGCGTATDKLGDAVCILSWYRYPLEKPLAR